MIFLPEELDRLSLYGVTPFKANQFKITMLVVVFGNVRLVDAQAVCMGATYRLVKCAIVSSLQ